MLKSVFKMALIQNAAHLDIHTGTEHVIRNIVKVAELGANVVVLPEMFCCPYVSELFSVYAQDVDGALLRRLSALAEAQKIYLIAGSVPERVEDRLYNTCFVFDPKGACIGRHRKVHLFDINVDGGQYFQESETLSAGQDVTVVDTVYGKIGIAICYDIRFPELARLMVDRGAQILVYPAAFNMTTGPAHWELLARARAVDNQVFVAACAPARDYDSGYIAYGHSLVVDPWGDVLGQLEEEEGYLLGEIDLDVVKDVRRQLPVLTQRREDVYAREKRELQVR